MLSQIQDSFTNEDATMLNPLTRIRSLLTFQNSRSTGRSVRQALAELIDASTFWRVDTEGCACKFWAKLNGSSRPQDERDICLVWKLFKNLIIRWNRKYRNVSPHMVSKNIRTERLTPSPNTINTKLNTLCLACVFTFSSPALLNLQYDSAIQKQLL